MDTKSAAAVIPFRRMSNGDLEVVIGRRRGQPEKDRWAYPGGHVQNGEEPKLGAIRELEEEAGIIACPEALQLLTIKSDPPYSIYIYALVIDDQSVEPKSNSDLADVQWCKVADLPLMAYSGDLYIRWAMDLFTETMAEDQVRNIAKLVD